MKRRYIEYGNDLIEAYKGYYEDDIRVDYGWKSIGTDFKGYELGWVILKIRSHTNQERLDVYLNWNGIIGFTGRVYEIATEEK